MSQKKNNLKRIVVYVSEEEHRQLKSVLALRGVTVADWIRGRIAELLGK